MKKPWGGYRLGKGLLVNRAINIILIFIATLISANYSLWQSWAYFCLVSGVVYYFAVLLYDKTRTDWILLEAFKVFGNSNKRNRITDSIVRWKKRGNWLVLTILIAWDPCLLVIYAREGSCLYNGFPTYKILLLFVVSILASSLVVVLQIKGIYLLVK